MVKTVLNPDPNPNTKYIFSARWTTAHAAAISFTKTVSKSFIADFFFLSEYLKEKVFAHRFHASDEIKAATEREMRLITP